MAFYKIQLYRSAIGLPKKVSLVLLSLGLRRRGNIVYQNISPVSAGKILSVKELVRVSLVEKKLTKEEHNNTLKSSKGYYVIKDDQDQLSV
ncbi:ribosomal protein L30 [Lipomyces arxii]|uniref:mitochondrial 54S ribosomal protein uL30m n=1 Tax=Lipomyces arxii TaxID=56418 RepID=UPI0034CFB61A